MNFLWFGLGLTVIIFGFVVAYGAPYLPTLKKQIAPALDLLDLKPGQTLLELGCGDGRVLKAAAKRGITCVGYELNPVLVIVAKLQTWPYRKTVRVKWANYWKIVWSPADGIFVFLLDGYMAKLDKKITQDCLQPVKLVSFAFLVPNKKISRETKGLYLYRYP